MVSDWRLWMAITFCTHRHNLYHLAPRSSAADAVQGSRLGLTSRSLYWAVQLEPISITTENSVNSAALESGAWLGGAGEDLSP